MLKGKGQWWLPFGECVKGSICPLLNIKGRKSFNNYPLINITLVNNYPFPIDSAPIGIPIGVKSIEIYALNYVKGSICPLLNIKGSSNKLVKDKPLLRYTTRENTIYNKYIFIRFLFRDSQVL